MLLIEGWNQGSKPLLEDYFPEQASHSSGPGDPSAMEMSSIQHLRLVEISMPNGSLYKGPVKDGLFYGQGEMSWKDGRSYKGTFTSGQISGRGVMIYPQDKRRYPWTKVEGNWRQNELLDGEVSILFSNGVKYEGGWKNGQYEGKGKLEYSSNEHHHFQEGEFRKGKFFNGSEVISRKGSGPITEIYVNGKPESLCYECPSCAVL